jgi:multiple sugar transport system ATP-binding protein
MNLIPGAIADGTFIGPDTRAHIAGIQSRQGVVLGIRPEDMDVAAPEGANLVSKIYSVEPTGDQTLVTTWAGEQLVVAKVDRAFRQAIDTTIAFKFRPDRVFLFDEASGTRI